MNTAHWHLLLNHTPIIGVFIGTLILIAGFIFKHPAIKKTALGVFVFAALFSVLAYLTGEGAEDVVEGLPDVTETQIEDHEGAGILFLILSDILGLFSLVTFIYDLRAKRTPFLYITVLMFSVVTCISGIQTGLSGGKVRHSEIRNGNPAQNIEPNKTKIGEDDEKD